ncbi:hypothetical protein GmHk_10G027676 [Glycine max]|nr:hypothetical protein GmHk_10G027676 [Glycine max]
MFSFFLSPTFPCLPYILKKLRGMSFGSRSFMQVVSDITLLSDFGPGFIPLSYQADTIFFLLAHTQHNLFFKQFPCADVVLLNKEIAVTDEIKGTVTDSLKKEFVGPSQFPKQTPMSVPENQIPDQLPKPPSKFQLKETAESLDNKLHASLAAEKLAWTCHWHHLLRHQHLNLLFCRFPNKQTFNFHPIIMTQ